MCYSILIVSVRCVTFVKWIKILGKKDAKKSAFGVLLGAIKPEGRVINVRFLKYRNFRVIKSCKFTDSIYLL